MGLQLPAEREEVVVGAEAQHEGEDLEPGLVPQRRESIRGEREQWLANCRTEESVSYSVTKIAYMVMQHYLTHAGLHLYELNHP